MILSFLIETVVLNWNKIKKINKSNKNCTLKKYVLSLW